MTVIKLITVLFGESKHISITMLSISSIRHREKIATLPIFFMTRCLCGNCQLMWREEENIFYREVDVVKNKNWEDVTVDSCRQKPDVLSSIQGLRKLVKAYSVCICFVTKHHYTALPWFSFSLF